MNWRGSLHALLVAAALGVVATSCPYQADRIWIGRVTGSIKSDTEILYVNRTSRIHTSDPERWILAREGRHVPDWRFLTKTLHGLPGVMARGCRSAPPIHQLHLGEMQDRFVRGSSDERLAEFVRVMREGTEAEQEKAVAAACPQPIDEH